MRYIRKPPYPAELLGKPYLEKYETPTLVLYDGRKGNAMEHVSKFMDSMGPFAGDRELCQRKFSKSLIDRAYTWYSTLQPNSIPTWEDMVESFCTKYFYGEKKVTIITLHNSKQKPFERLLDFIRWFRDIALDCYGQYKEQELVEICIDNIFPEYRAHLENLDIHQFAQLLQKARKTTLSVKPSVIDKPRPEKRNPPQALAVSGGESAAGVKRKRDDGAEQQELPPIPCIDEEIKVIVDKWVVDGVLRIIKPNR
ncbi:uncharacterized protein LOC115955531 [Quercus lobata]|uniref:uncharacterized protein LOC115955531 n=1 Tax=Quercus lobata TaxID=97700 RepID=UPI0012451FEF|nr:uncharacterized protein LOC115955531 [Quercus lobata]